MLARAARRKLRRDAFRSPTQLCEQLTLPWLCPAQMRWAASAGPITANAHDSRRKQLHPSALTPRNETRSLATTADLYPSHLPLPHDAIMQPWSAHAQPPGMATLQPWDPSNPLVLRPPVMAPVTMSKFGIGGEPAELHQNLHACLRVGRLDRATAIIERLQKAYHPWAPEAIEAHNRFLKSMFELFEQNPTATSMAELETWYDKHMLQKAIEPNDETFVTLLRASISLLEGQERTTAVQKYLNMAEECGESVIRGVNSSDDFSDKEWHVLISSQPERYNEPPPLEEDGELYISTPAGEANLIKHGIIPDPAHRIKPVAQKGYGLESLTKSLAEFKTGQGVQYPHEMEGTAEEKDRAYAYMRQLRIETDATNAAVERWKAEDQKLQDLGIHGVLKAKPMQALMWQWYSALLPLIKKEVTLTKQALSNPTPENLREERQKIGPWIEQCSPDKMAALTVSRVLQSCARGQRDDVNALKLSVLAGAIADDIEERAHSDAKAKHDAVLKKQRRQARKNLLSTLALRSSDANPAPRSNFQKQTESDAFDHKDWPSQIKVRVGALMLELLLQSATVTVTADDPKTGKQLSSTQRAFHHHVGFTQGKRTGWIAPHHDIMNKLQNEPMHGIASVKLPMVFEPKPWTAFEDGGFYTGKGSVIRTKLGGDAAQRAYAHSAIANGDMDQVLKGLDVLGKVPWQINSDLFLVMAEAWNAGEGIGGMVPAETNLQRPSEPATDVPATERFNWLKRMREYENTKSGLHSQRCFQNFQLEIARAFVKEEQIYFPHSVDFRGRAYPVPPLLNHIGADFARSLLRFANGKELGSVGLQWLKIHLANLYGYDKASLKDREHFAMEHLTEIYDSATNPLDGQRWWTKAEDPWQFLACCMELKNALDSPDPTRFLSHLPVHQDGTCNGLQHYAALGGDHAGASQVNLEPSDRPQDIYTGVADLVRDSVAKDAAEGHKMACFVKDHITRKVVKRTVMTNVYGVTFMGAKAQVLDELKDIFPDFEGTPEVKTLQQPALYIAFQIFAALGKIFNGAQEIQYWLGECGERITTSINAEQIKRLQERTEGKAASYDPKYKVHRFGFGQTTLKKLDKNLETFKSSIIWTTPLKMPVVQPYRKDGTHSIKTNIQDIAIVKRSATSTIDKRKQLQAFPPNFIHSLDASHMLLSALKCSEMGLDFAAVHDSFWTHAADIPDLNVILRDAFVRMHSEDIMGRLAAEFTARYAGSMYRAQILAGSEAGRKIAAWRKIHLGITRGDYMSTKVKDATFEEVALEGKRQDLLNSEDPEKRKEGEQMVTPTSIWLANQDPTAMASPRLGLLGDTSSDSQKKKALKEKVLGAEAEVMKSELETSGAEPADIEAETFAAVEAEEAQVEEAKIAAEAIDTEAAEDEEHAPSDTSKPAGKKRVNPPRYSITAWLPLTFPPVPKKGTWDVSRLRESKYFFS